MLTVEAPAEIEATQVSVRSPEHGRRQVTVPLVLTNPSSVNAQHVPISTGVCFPKGAIDAESQLQLHNEASEPITLQHVALAHWSDGSVQWMLLDFVAPSVRAGRSTWQLTAWSVPEADGPTLLEPAAWILSDGASATSGVAVIRIPDGRALPPTLPLHCRIHRFIVQFGHEAVRLQNADPMSAKCVCGMDATMRLRMIDSRGRSRTARFDRIAFDADGSVRSTARLDGRFPRSGGLNVQMRLTLYSTAGLVQLAVKLHNPNRARHRGGLWDLGDRGSRFFKSLFIELDLGDEKGSRQVSWATEAHGPFHSASASEIRISQGSSGGENWDSRNHTNRHGNVPCPFRGYQVRSQVGVEEGLRCSPTLTVNDGDRGSLAVAVPEFWQQFPKSLETDGRFVRIGLFPGEWNDLFELQGGEQKTHNTWLSFDGQSDPMAWVHSPVRAAPPPEWNDSSGVYSWFVPSDAQNDERLRDYLEQAFAGGRSVVARREAVDEYGWRNFGEVWADHEEGYCSAPKPVMSHYNNQFDTIYGAILQLARTGDAGWFDFFDPLARHVVDIDIYHTNRDRSAYNGGLFWHTDHYVDAGTCTHRSYSKLNQKPGLPYGGGPSDEHNYTTGLLYHYYLTGDLDARDAVLSLANWVLSVDDGRLTPLGAVDPGPTGLASATGSPDYHGPGRGAGNSVNALLDGWLISAQRKYLDYAEHLIRRVIHPNDNVDAMDLLNAEARWSYTVFLTVLARYLSLKAEAGQIDSMYAHAAASLQHYARWMVDNERPYLDHPEQLEYPTETWAAQEMRKANVLRLAAAHAKNEERERMMLRGNELAERAWSDLSQFDSKYVMRAIAIMMVEGARDCYFASGRDATVPDRESTLDVPKWTGSERTPFISQKRRVLNDARTLRGALRMSVRLLNPQCWPNLVRALITRL